MKLTTKLILAMALLLAAACGTPQNIVYFQDIKGEQSLKADKTVPIRLKPTDQISVIVSCLDPQVASMFNLPIYSNRIGQTSSSGSSSSSQGVSGYTVDSRGYIDFPILGKILVADLTREEVAEKIKEELIDSRQIKDPVVTVEFMNLGFAILGEVNNPGRYKIDRDRFTIFDALAVAGDLTINGQRENITLIRNNGDKDQTFQLNMLDAHQLYSSPAFYIQQGDMIYVTPNDKRVRESTINGNNVRSTAFWFSVTSMIMTVVLFVLRFIPGAN